MKVMHMLGSPWIQKRELVVYWWVEIDHRDEGERLTVLLQFIGPG